MKSIFIRFYEELNDFLPTEKQKKRFELSFKGVPSVKDLIESQGVPHVEIDMILVNGLSVDFSYLVNEKDDISVYPVFESFDISEVQHLRAKPLRKKKFVFDVHLGTLARYMRMLGFDVLYENNYTDDEIVKLSIKEKRTILTKDRGILKRNEVTHGYFVRNIQPEKQLKEVVERFQLRNGIKEFTRCFNCNTLLEKTELEKIEYLVPPKVKEFQKEFYYCIKCGKVYWKGSHYEKMKALIDRILLER